VHSGCVEASSGHLIQDALEDYVWNAENRLVK